MKKSLIFNRGAPLQPEDIILQAPERLRQQEGDEPGRDAVTCWLRGQLQAGQSDRLFESCMDLVASALVREALSLTQGNRSQAARLLGISRPTLHAKIDKYQIH